MKAIMQSRNELSGTMVLQACVSFVDLMNKAKFTFRIRPEDDPYSDKPNDYQRQLNMVHVKEIVKYLKKEILSVNKRSTAIFPTSMLIAFDSEDNLTPDEHGILDIEIPQDCYIVDGQHRLKAMIELFNEVLATCSFIEEDKEIYDFLNGYKFNCSILINYDLWEQSKIFADVNFTQKKVNKSLYYDIYGSYYSENATDLKQNAIYLAHSLVVFLNRNEYSPLNGQIKMLGNGKGVISQAFIVEALFLHISSPRGIWYFDIYKSVDKLILNRMKVELFSYLSAIKDSFFDYWNNNTSIMLKTTGLGALLRFMGYLHRVFDNNMIDTLGDSNSIYCNPYIEGVKKNLVCHKKYSKELFSTNKDYGKFCGTGGKGLEMALYKELCYIHQNGKASWENTNK